MSDCNCDDCCYEKNRRMKYKDCNCVECYGKRKNRECFCRKCKKSYQCEKKYIYCYEKQIDSCNCTASYEQCTKKNTCNKNEKSENEKSENENIIIININPLKK